MMRTLTSLLAALVMAAVAAADTPSGDPKTYKVETIAEGLNHPWDIAFLPDGGLLVTERDGGLRLIRDGKLQAAPIAGAPTTLTGGQGGLFDIVLDPDFASNQTVYLSFAAGTPQANATHVLKAQFDGAALRNSTTIFIASPSKPTKVHYGGRIVFLPDKTFLLSVGDAFVLRELAQDRSVHLGKILRLDRDGKAVPDNPFVTAPGMRPEIWSYGHRNPQGLFYDAESGKVFETEHGANKGDELNIITPGANYGWPVATWSMDYSGAVISPSPVMAGVTDPIAVWPEETLAPGGVIVYRGALFPLWAGSVMIPSLVQKEVRRVTLGADGRAVSQERLFGELGFRLRAVEAAPDGSLYLLTDDAQGKVLRVTPAGG